MSSRPTSVSLLALLLSLPLVSPAMVEAQNGDPGSGWERQVYAFEVLDEEGQPLAHPLLGGLNLPRPQLADIDGDGDDDLFVQEYSNKVMYFERVDDSGEGRWVWRTDAFHDLEIGEWYHLYDLDGDGDLDMLGEWPFSHVRYYRNDGTPQEPRFTDLGRALTTEGEFLFSDRQNIPKLGNLDGDDELDLLIGKVEGTISRWELDGFHEDSGVPVFDFVEDHFQDIEIIGQILGVPQGFRQQQDNAAAAAPGVEPDTDGETAELRAHRGTLHGANTMALYDVDGDGDDDLFWGDFFEPGLLFIENRGTPRSPSMRGEPQPFPLGDPVKTSGYNAPAFGDVDGDGQDDLLMGVLGGAFNPASTSRENLWYFERTGRRDFAARTSRALTMIDVGAESFPAFADIDGDGDLDLFLGNKIEQDDTQAGRLRFFENIGSPTAPRFQARGELDGFDEFFHYAPAFGDLDGDGDLDILLGTWEDELQLVRNEGDPSAPVWSFENAEIVKLTRGRNSTPTLGDVDGDGDLDLFVGESSGEVNFWRNVGSSTEPSFELVADKFLEIDAGRRSSPHLADVDGDGDLDLLIGSEAEGLWLYRNVGTATDPVFEHDPSFDPPVHPFVTPSWVDLDGDGAAELYVGGIGGGLERFVHSGSRGDGSVSLVGDERRTAGAVHSERRASIGSMRRARRAGAQLARSPAPTMTAASARAGRPMVSGTANGSTRVARASSRARAKPPAAPASNWRIERAMTVRRIELREAPSAMRTPISRVLLDTAIAARA